MSDHYPSSYPLKRASGTLYQSFGYFKMFTTALQARVSYFLFKKDFIFCLSSSPVVPGDGNSALLRP